MSVPHVYSTVSIIKMNSMKLVLSSVPVSLIYYCTLISSCTFHIHYDTCDYQSITGSSVLFLFMVVSWKLKVQKITGCFDFTL